MLQSTNTGVARKAALRKMFNLKYATNDNSSGKVIYDFEDVDSYEVYE